MTPNATGLGTPSLNLIETLSEAQEFLDWLQEDRPLGLIGVDIETGEIPGHDPKDALSPWHGKIRLVQVGDANKSWAMSWDDWAGVFYQGLNNYKGLIVFHNVAFEAKWFSVHSRWRFPWHLAHDTMLMAQIIHPDQKAGLKPLTERLVDPRAALLQSTLDKAFKDNGWTWGTVPVNFPAYWQYGALDCVITVRLFLDHFWDQVKPGAQFATPYELEMNVRRIATTMEINGARVDLNYCAEKFQSLSQYTESVKEWGKKTYGKSITSPIQMAQLFQSLGATITKRTPSGNASMDKDQLELFSRDPDPQIRMLATTILQQRQADKLASSYFSNFQKDAIDGVLHPSINIMAARTSRMSITNPALQTLPANDPLVRDAFIPRREGEVLISSDLDQVEFRLTANFSEDAALIELFHEADRTGGDVFTSIMRQVYQDNTLDKDRDSDKRKLIKGTVYGKLYGAGVDKMASTAGVPYGQMREVVTAFDASYPGVKLFQKKVESEGQYRLDTEGSAYVLTKTGRRLPADSDRLYSLTNYKIQASAAEIFKQNLVKLDQENLTDYMVVPVHDEIVLSVPKEDVADMLPVIQEAMTTRDGWDVPLTSGAEGPFPTWGWKYHKENKGKTWTP